MPNKRFSLISSSPFPWVCPVCQQALTVHPKTWRCTNNHSFDVARSGYVNLLLANQKSSATPGDSGEMLNARKAFLAAGHFDPVIERLAEMIRHSASSAPVHPTALADEHLPRRLLDIGCGEGYYLDWLMDLLGQGYNFAGVDIAREGLQIAARRNANVQWVCASNTRLPLADQSIDVVTRIFAPSNAAELARVLKPDAALIVVTPGARHLFELKQALYDEVMLHEKSEVPEGFAMVAEEEIHFVLHLDKTTDIINLLKMTPFFWRGSQAGREQLMKLTHLQIQAHVHFGCFRPL